MGVTESGKFAVLTNYRESGAVEGNRSRGAMVTECLNGPEEESTEELVERLLASDVKGVGGFSLVCGKLRKSLDEGVEPLAIVSNRSSSLEKIPWIAGGRGHIHGLSNARYGDAEWPKVQIGKELLNMALERHRARGLKEQELLDEFWKILDHDTLPERGSETFEEYVGHLKESVFVHELGGKLRNEEGGKLKADEIAAAGDVTEPVLEVNGNGACRKQSPVSEADGMAEEVYGTQRQTVMLVDWNGKCSYIERSLWDEQGNAIPRGKGDMKFEFQIKGWSSAENNM